MAHSPFPATIPMLIANTVKRQTLKGGARFGVLSAVDEHDEPIAQHQRQPAHPAHDDDEDQGGSEEDAEQLGLTVADVAR